MAGQTFYAFYEKFGSWPKTGFLTHDFGHRNASKSIKGSIDTDFSLVFKKTLSQKNGSMDWGQVQVAKNSKTCLHCDVTSSKCKTENIKRFFSMSTRTIAESVEDLNSSLALAAGNLWPKRVGQLWPLKG